MGTGVAQRKQGHQHKANDEHETLMLEKGTGATEEKASVVVSKTQTRKKLGRGRELLGTSIGVYNSVIESSITHLQTYAVKPVTGDKLQRHEAHK